MHRRSEVRAASADGCGEWVIDYEVPDPAPVTTIAWRIVHIAAVNYLYWDYAFGPATASFDLDIPGDAGGSHALAVRSQEIVGVLAAATFPTTVMALATGPIARSKTGEHDPLFRSQCLSTTRALPHATEMAQPADED